MSKVANDICVSCPHCQIYKISRQVVGPPILKIQPTCPFEIVATDIMLLPKTRRGNIGVLVAIDLYSKWLIAVPIRDKKGSTVSRLFYSNILPNLQKVPSKVLSDNGKEFICHEFRNMLKEFGIDHVK